jgi:creatinine amidohydrolase
LKKRELFLEDLSWTEIAEKIRKRGFDRVILITASMEQHGPHLPTSTDTLIGYQLGEALARRLGRTMIAPAVRPGCGGGHPEHMPGTIELTRALFRETVRRYIRSLEGMGFRNIILLNSHGGQHQDVRRVWEEEREDTKSVAKKNGHANLIFAVDNVEYYRLRWS